jgi:hypothetical protein
MNTAYIFLAVLVLILYSVTLWTSSVEDFENQSGDTFESSEEMYDDTNGVRSVNQNY